ncbi:hypothetical protein [Microbispora sp. H10949]|uniref:hypothetical protein n=1 Tax=Microbispora sp. H10949 TaxID=2729111 RepID=UPI0016011A8B|nr:hypothetical protein [Microbispora sp. H10949]
MTTSELAAVEALLVKALPDPMGFAERVLGELAERLATAPPGDGPAVLKAHESAAYQALVDRNTLLAAALGACECWGEDAGCPGCGGEGSAGWVPPDPELYAEYVVPVTRRISSAGPAVTGTAEPPVMNHRLGSAAAVGASLTNRPGEGEVR